MLDDVSKDKVMVVNLMTIHKSKGLEFKCVFIISVNEGIIPASIKDYNLIEEERRLCYGAQRLQEIGTCQGICSVNF